jgi:hypothetical protein
MKRYERFLLSTVETSWGSEDWLLFLSSSGLGETKRLGRILNRITLLPVGCALRTEKMAQRLHPTGTEAPERQGGEPGLGMLSLRL